MEDLLKKLDDKMMSDFVRKIGGLFCLVTVVVMLAAIIIGASALLKSPEGTDEAVAEATAEEAGEEAAGDEELTEETEEATEAEEAEHVDAEASEE